MDINKAYNQHKRTVKLNGYKPMPVEDFIEFAMRLSSFYYKYNADEKDVYAVILNGALRIVQKGKAQPNNLFV